MKKLFIDCQHKCPPCDTMFPNISHLISHLKTHRKINNQKSKRLRAADLEDLQVVPKKSKASNSEGECRGVSADVQVKQEIETLNEESWPEPEISKEMRLKFQGNNYPDEGHERNAESFLRNHQPINTEKQISCWEDERKIVKKQQRCLYSYQGENKSTGTLYGQDTDPLDKLDIHIRTDTKKVPGSIASCSTEFSMTNYIQKLCKCNVCDDVFSSPELLRRHFMTEHATLSKKSGDAKRLCESVENYDTESPTGKILSTEKLIAEELQESNHKQKTSNEVTNVNSEWGICGEKWNSQSQYKSHILTRHATKHKGKLGIFFKCNICGQKCSGKYVFESHLKRHTSRERSFKCNTCGKSFFRKGELVRHMKIHTGVFEYTCDICRKGFHDKGSLQNHIRKHKCEETDTCTNLRKSSKP
ncbi:oocyte zinc finger protein XlCOF6-like, partial [Mizuhopecten yessoensis]